MARRFPPDHQPPEAWRRQTIRDIQLVTNPDVRLAMMSRFADIGFAHTVGRFGHADALADDLLDSIRPLQMPIAPEPDPVLPESELRALWGDR